MYTLFVLLFHLISRPLLQQYERFNIRTFFSNRGMSAGREGYSLYVNLFRFNLYYIDGSQVYP